MLYNSRVFKDIYKKKFEVQNSEKRIQNEKMKQKFSFESPSFSSSSFSDSSSSVDNQQQTKNKSKIKTYSKKTTFELHQFDIAQTEKFVPKYRGSVSMVPTSFNIIDILKSKNKEKNDNTKRKSYLENQLVNDKKFMNIIENAYKKKYDKKEDLIDKSKNFIEKRRQSQIILKNINNFNINNNQKKNKSRFSSIVIPNKINLFDDNNNIIIDNKSNNSSPFNIKKNVKKIASENAINKYKINNSNSHSKIHKNNIEKISFDIKQFKINLPKKHDLKFTHFNLKNNNLPTINSIDNNKNTTESYTNTYYNDYKYSNEFLFKSENEFNLNRNKDLLNIIEKHKPFENKNLFKINYHKKNKSNNTNNIAIKNGNKNIKILITAPNKKEYFFNAKNHKKKLYNFLEKIETLRNFVTTPGHDSLVSF